MDREQAFQYLTSQITNPNLIKHHLAAEAVMRGLALYLKSKGVNEQIDENNWALAGLLHDADYEKTHDNPKLHTVMLEQELKDKVDPLVMHAIKCHNEMTNTEPKSLMDWSMYCSDELTGIIIAACLVHPDRKLMSLYPDYILNRFNEKSFARGANRDKIKKCEERLEIPLKEFIAISLQAMQSIATDLGFS